MPATWNGTLSTGRSEPLAIPGLAWPIELRPHPRARAIRLRLDEARERLVLTFPRRMSRRTALDWAAGQGAWVDRQLAMVQPGEPFAPGTEIPFEGRAIELQWDERLPRTPRLSGDILACGGPVIGFAGRIERFLKAKARARLSEATAEIARTAGVTVKSVSIGDAGSRWGSCSSSGRIRLSWRLILAPPEVRRYVVAHEVAHLRHLNHGPEFKTLEARLFGPGLAEARSKLKRVGPRLRLIGPRR